MSNFGPDPVKKGFVTLSWDMKEFSDALKLYEEATKKELAVIINEKSQRICMGAAQKIKKARKINDIKSGLWNALATGKTKKGITKFGAAVKGKGNQGIADKIYSSRARSYGYSRALWYKLAQDLGKQMVSQFKIKHAHGEKAVKGPVPTARMEIIGLEQDHIDQFMSPALEKSIAKEAKSMVKYATDKLAKIAAQRSGRKSR